MPSGRLKLRAADGSTALIVTLLLALCGHEFKLQTGVEYTLTDDAARDGGYYRGWGWTTGLRLGW